MHPFFYSRWDDAMQEHASRFEATISKRGQLGYITGAEDVDLPALVAGLREVTAPVLVVTGSRDAMSGHAAGDLVAASFPQAQVVTVEGAGHHPWLDEPAGFRSAVDAFVTL
jgi:pimeloyl-ACP methyl ester carboxylesterase